MSTTFPTETARILRQQKALAEGALAQVDDDAFFAALGAETNSLAILVKHLAGNLRSRWTDFLTTDGEKPDRDRDGEFVIRAGDSRASLMVAWEDGWRRCIETVDSLTESDLDRNVHIRGEPHSVVGAVQRALAHAAHHVGQIVLLSKHASAEHWETLSIPRGGSEAFTARMEERQS